MSIGKAVPLSHLSQGRTNMDPNATLEELRDKVSYTRAHPTTRFDADDLERFADLVEALDEWLSSGGFLPTAWNGARA